MSDLENLRDHARRLSTADHRDDCERIHRIMKLIRWLEDADLDGTLSCADTTGHDQHEWVASNGREYVCPGLCGGCMPDAERHLWQQIADELDAYLAPDDEGPGLFGGGVS